MKTILFGKFFSLCLILAATIIFTGCITQDGNKISIGLPSMQSLFPPYDKSRELVIPKNARNISFMEGSWVTFASLLDTQKNTALTDYYEFNKGGQGKITSKWGNATCAGQANADLFGDAVQIIITDVKCSNRQVFSNAIITCENEEAEGVVWRATDLENARPFHFKLLWR